MNRIRGLIWDVDGTLSNTIDLCVTGLQTAIAAFGGPTYSRQGIISMFGPTEDGILRNVVGDLWPQAMETYLDAYRAGHDENDLSYPDVVRIVDDLAATDLPMAVVTGKGERACAITLSSLGLDGVFDPVACGSMEGSVKSVEIDRIVDMWGFEPSSVAYIGDAPSDIDEATAAGVVAVAAAWKDDADVEALVTRRPHVVVADASALRAWIDERVDLPWGTPGSSSSRG